MPAKKRTTTRRYGGGSNRAETEVREAIALYFSVSDFQRKNPGAHLPTVDEFFAYAGGLLAIRKPKKQSYNRHLEAFFQWLYPSLHREVLADEMMRCFNVLYYSLTSYNYIKLYIAALLEHRGRGTAAHKEATEKMRAEERLFGAQIGWFLGAHMPAIVRFKSEIVGTVLNLVENTFLPNARVPTGTTVPAIDREILVDIQRGYLSQKGKQCMYPLFLLLRAGGRA